MLGVARYPSQPSSRQRFVEAPIVGSGSRRIVGNPYLSGLWKGCPLSGRLLSVPRNAAPALLGCRSFVCNPIEHALATSQPVARPRFRKAVDWPDHLRDWISNHDRRSAVDRGADSE